MNRIVALLYAHVALMVTQAASIMPYHSIAYLDTEVGRSPCGDRPSDSRAYLGLTVVITINCSGVPWLKNEPTAYGLSFVGKPSKRVVLYSYQSGPGKSGRAGASS